MKKLSVVLLVLLLAGIGVAFGQTEHSACRDQCPSAGCGGEGGCKACCGDNCAACCGSSNSQSASATPVCAVKCAGEGCGSAGGCQSCCGDDCASCCGDNCAVCCKDNCAACCGDNCVACCGDNCDDCCGSSTAENTDTISPCGKQFPKGGCEVAGGCRA